VSIGTEGTVGLITYMRTDSVNLGNDAGAEIARSSRAISARSAAECESVPQQVEERAGSAQTIRPTSAAHFSDIAPFLQRSAQALRPDLEARDRQPDAVRNVEHRVGRFRCRRRFDVSRDGTTIVDPGFLAV
jgi:DNA topoisomerase-1